MSEPRKDPLAVVALAQGGYYVVTGFWPVIDLRSFQMVTGPKHDTWLVQTTGALIGAIGGVLTFAGLQRRVDPETTLLALTSAATLAAADVVFVAKRRIPPVYLLDALGECALMGGWLLAWNRRGDLPGNSQA